MPVRAIRRLDGELHQVFRGPNGLENRRSVKRRVFPNRHRDFIAGFTS